MSREREEDEEEEWFISNSHSLLIEYVSAHVLDSVLQYHRLMYWALEK